MKCVDLFAGIGGFRYGLERSKNKFEFVYANQFEPSTKNQFAYEFYKRKFGECSNKNIFEVDASEIPEHDLLCAGFPCQDFIVANSNAEGLNGSKGSLFYEIIRIAKEKQPKYLLLENVDRILSFKKGETFKTILRELCSINYTVEWRVLSGEKHGLSQRRKRVYMLCTNKKYEVDKILLRSFEYDKCKNLSINSNFERVDKFENYGTLDSFCLQMCSIEEKDNFVSIENILDSEVDEKYFLSDEEVARFNYLRGAKSIKRVKNGFEYVFKEGSMPQTDSIKKYSRTVLTSEKQKNRSTHIIEQNGKRRFITPSEVEKLFGYEKDYTSSLTERQRYFCLGNSVLVDLITKIGDGLDVY